MPGIVGRVKDPLAKYYLALRLSVPRKVGMIIAANPSTLVNLARAGDQEKEALLRDIHDGTLASASTFPPTSAPTCAAASRKRHPDHVRELEEIIRRTGTLYPKDYWPTDCIIGNWMGGSVGAYLRHFPKYFGDTPDPRCRPDRQRRAHDDPDGRRHSQRRARRHLALSSNSFPRRKAIARNPTVWPPTSFRLAEPITSIDDRLRALPLQHLRRGPLHRFFQQHAADRVPQQGIAFRQSHRRKGVRIPRRRARWPTYCAV